LSGVQLDNSPAVATRSLDISSWEEADISTMTSSAKKRYNRRKSALKDYFTTEEPLDQIALRYHFPPKMLEKLVKRCFMQHEDGAPWGYRALVPGITVVDHTSAPEPEPAPVADGIHEDLKTDTIGDKDGTNEDEGADGEADAMHGDAEPDAIDDDGRADEDGGADEGGGADAMNRVPTEPDLPIDDDAVGTRFIASASPSALVSASPSVPKSVVDDAVGTRFIASASPSAPVLASPSDPISDPPPDPVSSLENTPMNDDEDTAQRKAIVLPPQNSTATDDISDIIGIEETSAREQLEDNRENGEARADGEADGGTGTDGGTDAMNRVPTDSEPVVDDGVGTRFIASDPVSDTISTSDEEPTVVETKEAFLENDILTLSADIVVSVNDTEEVLPEDDVLAVSEQVIQPAVVEGVVDKMDVEVVHTPLPDVARGDSGAFYMPELVDRVNRGLVMRERMLAAALPRTSKKYAAIPGKKTIIAQRSIRKRWVRSVERTRKRKVYRLIGAAVVAVLFLSLLIPVGAGLAAYSAYNSIKGIALDGVNHLLDVKTLLPVSKSDLTAALNPAKLQQANADFTQAQGDFLQLQQLVNRQDIQSMVQQFAPQYSNKLDMAQRLVQVGIDVTRMGSELIGVAMLGANVLHGSPLATGSTKPLITVSDVSNIEGTMLHALYYIQDIKAQMSQVSLSQLPISLAQQKEIASAMTLLPKAQSYIEQGQGVIGIVSWLLGVGHARRFLVQTMDRAELRPSGGFTGQYGVFTVQDGRMAPFTLQDVTELDYNGNGAELGRPAPPGYTSWMNFGNFGLRDSNLSGDFPTSAQIAMQVFQQEGGGPIDGDIMFTPTTIEHVLDIIGPLKIPSYNETITAQNLEDKLHYYQNDPAAIALQREKTGTHNAATRKSFTALVGSTLLNTVRHLPVNTLMKVVQNAVKDIQARDLEIYFNNPQAEGWLVAHNFSGAMSTFSKVDGFMVVQSNISISKASNDVQTTEQDSITLDPQGGATHNLTITLDYRGTQPIYSVYTTYADYIRVYAPANAVLEGGNGFDTGKALCTPPQVGTPTGTGNPGPGPVKPPHNPPNPGDGTPPLPPCDQFMKTYTNSTVNCPDGNYDMGQRGWVQGKGYSNWAIDAPGAPTELTSDLPGRAMWGGLTVTPKNCISTISLTWYVPNAVKHVVGQPLYAVLVQKQGGYVPVVQITIDTSQLNGVKPYSFNGSIYGDRLFSLAVVKKGH
jgi:Protein of unknown function (DUF4012)